MTLTPTASPSSGSSMTGYKTSPGVLGAAIAVPLILAAILGLTAWVLVVQYRRRRTAEMLVREWEGRMAGVGMAHDGSGGGGGGVVHLTSSPRKPSELDGSTHFGGRGELPAFEGGR